MITDEQERAVIESMRNAWSGHTPAEVDTLLSWARQELSRRERHDDGPITAEWCREQGGESCDESDCHGELLPCYRWEVGRVWVVVELWSDGVVIARVCHANWKENPTRRQLLALLAALRGEPLVSRGQMNNIGPSR